MARLVVEPLTRVEGHGRVELMLGPNGLEDVKVRLLESPRLFEAMVIGRRYDEVSDLVCRICAICSAVHKLASLKALEQSQGVETPPLALAIRELLLLGGHIQSHALHLFCLILPDFAGEQSIVDLLREGDSLAKTGLGLKAFANRIQEVAGGRVIHPVNPVLGGVVYRPMTNQLDRLLGELDEWQTCWPGIAEEFLSRSSYPVAEPTCGRSLATGPANEFALTGDRLWTGEGHHQPVVEYAELLKERTVGYSYARQSVGGNAPFLVGALARLRLAAERGCSPAELPAGSDIHANNTAQISEIGWALGRVRQLVEQVAAAPLDALLRSACPPPRAGIGTAAMEAPRGTLIHHYIVDEWGHVVTADVVTPTAINQLAMTEQVIADLNGETGPGMLKETSEKIIRSFDPCISCAVHVMEC